MSFGGLPATGEQYSDMVNVNRRGSLLLRQFASILRLIGVERCRGNPVLAAARAVLYELGVYRTSLGGLHGRALFQPWSM